MKRVAMKRVATFLGASLGAGALAAAMAGVGLAQTTADNPAVIQNLTFELNKLEPQGDACRVYLLIDNPGGVRYETFKLDLFLFDQEGVIAKRFAVETGPLRAAKTSIKLFDAADLDCATVGRVMINDVMECASASGGEGDCIERIETKSRASAPLTK